MMLGNSFGEQTYSLQKKTYKHLMGQAQVHQIFRSLWRNKCQPKHKVFLALAKKQTQYKRYAEKEKHEP
jgi:hypothetical protein